MWKLLLDIKSDLSKVVTENLALRKDVEELKSAVRFKHGYSKDSSRANLCCSKEVRGGPRAAQKRHQ